MPADSGRTCYSYKGTSRFGEGGKGFEGAEYRGGPAPAGAGRPGRCSVLGCSGARPGARPRKGASRFGFGLCLARKRRNDAAACRGSLSAAATGQISGLPARALGWERRRDVDRGLRADLSVWRRLRATRGGGDERRGRGEGANGEHDVATALAQALGGISVAIHEPAIGGQEPDASRPGGGVDPP